MDFYSIFCLTDPKGLDVSEKSVGGTLDPIARLSLLALALIAVAVAGFWLGTPAAVDAVCLCPDGPPNDATSQGWKSASNCNDALAALQASLEPEAHATCGGRLQTCNKQLDAVCYEVSPGLFNADGFLRFSCKECGPPTP